MSAARLPREDVELRRAGAPPLWLTVTRAPDPRSGLALVHGFGEHGGRYDSVARELSARGVTSVRVDLRGFGRSGGPRAASRRFEELEADAAAALSRLSNELPPGRPRALLGHSLGGLVALSVALAHPDSLDLLLLTSPALRLRLAVPRWKRALAALAAPLAPALSLPAGIDPYLLTHDLACVSAFQRDPLRVRSARAGPFRDMLHAQRRVLASAGELAVPLQVWVGGRDAIADEAAAGELVARARCAHLSRRPAAGHEVLFETDAADLPDEIARLLVGAGSRT